MNPCPKILSRMRDSRSVRSGSLSAARKMEWNWRLLRWTVPSRSTRMLYSCEDIMRCWTAIPMTWVYWSWNWLTSVLFTMYRATRRSEKLGTKVYWPCCIVGSGCVVGCCKLKVDGGLGEGN